MRIPKQTLLFILFVAGLAATFNNCQQDVGFETGSGDLGSSGPTPDPDPPADPTPTDPGTPPPPPPPAPGDVREVCETGVKQYSVATVQFPKPNQTCEWGKSGNLSARNNYFQGRIEQAKELNLPSKSKICNLVFTFNQQAFLYDDHFIFTLNNSILASSYDFRDELQTANGLLQYDWSRIAGTYWDQNSKEVVYCASVQDGAGARYSGSCSWPDTDISGTIRMSFPPEVLYSVMSAEASRLNHEFKFISIGDNDDMDCEHSTIQFSVQIEYVSTP